MASSICVLVHQGKGKRIARADAFYSMAGVVTGSLGDVTASRTAEYVALYRTLETSEPSRAPLFIDPFAERFLSGPLAAALRLARVRPLRSALVCYADWRAPGARTSAIGRTRFIDDIVGRECAAGATQFVILGAGYDCRAHRLPEIANVRVFEVDRADTQAEKRVRLGRSHSGYGTLNGHRGARPIRDDVVYVAVDFNRDVLATRLVAAGWSPTARSIFIWEGVTNYLDATAVQAVLEFIGKTAGGSVLVFTYIHRSVIDGTATFAGVEKVVQNVRRMGEPWTFGLLLEEVAAFVGRFGLTLEKNLGADEYRELYFPSHRRAPRGYGFYRVAVTRVPPD